MLMMHAMTRNSSGVLLSPRPWKDAGVGIIPQAADQPAQHDDHVDPALVRGVGWTASSSAMMGRLTRMPTMESGTMPTMSAV